MSEALQDAGCQVLQASADADVLLVKTTMEKAREQDTALVGDDADLLLMLCNLSTNESHDTYFRPEPKANQKCPPTCWKVGALQVALGPDVCSCLMFSHALTGCNTTSRLSDVGEPSAPNKLIKYPFLRQQAVPFTVIGTEKSIIFEAGEQAIVCLYGGTPGDSMDKLRCSHFIRKCHPPLQLSI